MFIHLCSLPNVLRSLWVVFSSFELCCAFSPLYQIRGRVSRSRTYLTYLSSPSSYHLDTIGTLSPYFINILCFFLSLNKRKALLLYPSCNSQNLLEFMIFGWLQLRTCFGIICFYSNVNGESFVDESCLKNFKPCVYDELVNL